MDKDEVEALPRAVAEVRKHMARLETEVVNLGRENVILRAERDRCLEELSKYQNKYGSFERIKDKVSDFVDTIRRGPTDPEI